MDEYVDIRVGSGAIKLFQRIEIPIFNAFCEFIDNSLQSYLEHENELKNVAQQRCKVEVSWTNDQIIIKDNAFGMDREAFGRAMKWNAPRDNYPVGSLSKYGMGLKYAAINLGTVWGIQSTELGSDVEYNGTVDSDYLSRENPEKLPLFRKNVSKGQHYTIITITKLHKKFTEKDLNEALSKLGIIYQYFLNKNLLSIEINNNKVTYDEPKYWLDDDGNEYYEIISNGKFNYGGKMYEYTGAIGILNKGSRSKAGLTLMQNHRGISLYYKPHELFGDAGNFRSQRIVGTIEFSGDNWIARVSKDGLLWQSSGLEEKFLSDLKGKENFQRLVKICGELRKRTSGKVKIKLVSTGQSDISGLKSSYKIDERAVFDVKPKPGWELKEVKWGTVLLTPDVSGTSKYVYSIPADSLNEVTIRVKTTVISDLHGDLNETDCPNHNSQPTQDTDNSAPSANSDANSEQYSHNFLEQTIKIINSKFKKLKSRRCSYSSSATVGDVYKDGVYIEFQNTNIGFEIKESDASSGNNWIELIEKPGYSRSFILTINYGSGLFGSVGINDDLKRYMILMGVIISLSRIVSSSDGVKKEDANIILANLNRIIKDSGDDE